MNASTHPGVGMHAQDIFSSRADAISGKDVKEKVEELNDCIAELVTDIVDWTSNSRFRDRNRKELIPIVCDDLKKHPDGIRDVCLCLIENKMDKNRRGLLEEIVFLDMIYSHLYESFFAGRYFFGKHRASGSDASFEHVLQKCKIFLSPSEIQLTFLLDPQTTALRWRAMTADAAVSSNSNMDQQPTSTSTEETSEILQKAFKICHPFGSVSYVNQFNKTLKKHTPRIEAILEKAQFLAQALQCDVVSCLMRVTLAPLEVQPTTRRYQAADLKVCRSIWAELPLEDGERVLATCGLGLERIENLKQETAAEWLILAGVAPAKVIRGIGS